MVFDYNLNGAELPWLYNKAAYKGSKSQEFAGFNVPKVTIGEKYYAKFNTGWTAVIIKSFVLVGGEAKVIVIAPDGKEYGMGPFTEFFKTIEDAKVRAANPNYSDYENAAGGVRYVKRENVMAWNHYEHLPFQSNCSFVGYVYENNVVEKVNLEIDYLWIDIDGIHYRISTKNNIEEVYKTKDECIANDFKVVDFDKDYEDDRDVLKKFTIMVEVYAEDVEQARLMIKVE